MRRKCIPPAVYPPYKKSLPRQRRLVVPVEENVPFTLPITICCDFCTKNIDQGTELCVHKEEAIDEKYPDSEIYLMCFDCTYCSADIWIRTDPENKVYVVDSGATKKLVEEDDGQSQHATVSADATLEDCVATPAHSFEYKYDVFLSFHWEDTGTSFTSHFLAALDRKGICAYRGEEGGPELLKEIKTSNIAVVVFSENYATSRWCLNELVQIMECRRLFNQWVIPIFYDVSPSKVQNQEGNLVEALLNGPEDEVKSWRVALTDAVNMRGLHLKPDRLEAEFIEEVVEVIWKRLKGKKGKMEAEEGRDALKSMEVLAALDEMKSMESQQATVSADAMLEDWPAKTARKILAMSDAPKFVENRTLDSMTDGLKSVENPTLDSKREIAALDEMKSMESQHATVSADATLEDCVATRAHSFEYKYDVFLSFHGSDTRRSFTSHFFAALVRKGIRVYRGEEGGPKLLKEIETSNIAVVVFSKNYATSHWCLDELVKIMECKRVFNQRVIPIFYDVSPFEVRNQKGNLAEGLLKGPEDKVKSWRVALKDAANLVGFHLKPYCLEAEFIEEIVEVIWKRLKGKKGKMEAEERGDALKSMEVLAVLDEMKSIKSQQAAVSADAMLEDWPAKTAKKILAMSDAPKFVENRTLDSMTDGLKSVENTTLDSKREIAALDEMKSMESQHATVSADATLEDCVATRAHSFEYKYDVFLSFHGSDTRRSFTSHFFAALYRNGICAYIGEEGRPELLKEIETSNIAVVVFSKNYATSHWCLDELVKIMECKRVFNQRVIPIFYDVSPFEVQNQKGNLAEGLLNGPEDKVKSWRAALIDIANIVGFHLKPDRPEAEFIEEIVEVIQKRLEGKKGKMEAEERGDALKSMEVHAVLDEMKPIKSQQAAVSADAMLEDWPAKTAKKILAMSDAPKFVENRTLDSTTDGLKSVENTTLDSKREIAALDEMKSMESQHATVSADATIEDCVATRAHSFEYKYDVFLSFHWEDTGTSFTSHFSAALDRKGICAYLGEEGRPELLKEIETSNIAVVLLSKNYATSRWCLNELVQIMECRRLFNQLVIPIFYDVSPSEVRKENENFAVALLNGPEDKVKSWRAALIDISNIAGFHLMPDRPEAELIEEIVEFIWKRPKGNKWKMEAEEGGDALESMEVLAALDEMKSMESQQATVSADAMLDDWPAKTAKKILVMSDAPKFVVNRTLDSTTDGLKSVENTTLDSKREIAALDEMKLMESQHATVSADATIEDCVATRAHSFEYKYDVFLNFRGSDIRRGFISHFFAALDRKGIHAYRGEVGGPELLKEIETSNIAVVVFSKNYATSHWCLDELVKIMECKRVFNQRVIPIFYDVSPFEVRNQKGNLAEALLNGPEDKVNSWKVALTDAANMAGLRLKPYRPEAAFVEEIVEVIWKILKGESSTVKYR